MLPKQEAEEAKTGNGNGNGTKKNHDEPSDNIETTHVEPFPILETKNDGANILQAEDDDMD